ncbi:hypothetical protein DV737_g3617, partial [Chaetothyriales sp. CBS 132003]
MAPSVDPSQWTYADYVCFLRAHGFPNLGMLDEYLEWGLDARNTLHPTRQAEHSKTALLEFNKNETRISDLSDLNKLCVLLNEWTRPKSADSTASSTLTGRILLVENISPAIIHILGGILNIDPNFFASHLEDSSMAHLRDSSASPSLASKSARDQNEFFNIEYISAFIPIGCPKEAEGGPLHCIGNYPRRVDVVQKQGRQKVALARRKISFFMNKSLDPWLSVVLVDPPMGQFCSDFAGFGAIVPLQSFAVVPYDGGYLDFVSMRKPLDRHHHDFRDCRHRRTTPSPFDELVRHYQIQARDGLFATRAQSLPTYMRPCLQIAASETNSFFNYIQTTLYSSQQQQLAVLSSITDHPKARRQLDRAISIDMCLARFDPILTRTKAFVSSGSTPELKEDYRALLLALHQYRAACYSQLQQITSVLSAQDSLSLSSMSSEAIRRADYLRYLTIIALIYAPFALACAIFSMPHDFAPAAHYLYGFLPVTAAVTLAFVLLVLPESRDPFSLLREYICGGLTRKKMLRDRNVKRRPGSRGTDSTVRELLGWNDV